MLIFLSIIDNLLKPYWDTLRKKLAQANVSPLTITHSPNILGHPIGIIILLISGTYVWPQNPKFFLFWFIMIGIAALSSILNIWGLVRTKFFGVQIVGRLGFVTSTIFAVLLLGEQLNQLKIIALVLAVVGVIVFTWPKNIRSFRFDYGIFFTVIAVTLGGLAAVFYKMATFYTPDYATFLTGRFMGDLIGWTLVWLVAMVIIKRNPAAELVKCVNNKSGRLMILGLAASTLLTSWLIYKLPVSLLAMLSTLVFPASYFFSHFKFKEKITRQMWLGTILIIISVVFFIISNHYIIRP
jgi:drug/metabolite transporter (DMT)-like permease